jgi:microcystin-dependent protein
MPDPTLIAAVAIFGATYAVLRSQRFALPRLLGARSATRRQALSCVVQSLGRLVTVCDHPSDFSCRVHAGERSHAAISTSPAQTMPPSVASGRDRKGQ